MVDRRDQVFTTSFLFASFSTETLVIRCASINGPFFRRTCHVSLSGEASLNLLRAAVHDEDIGPLVVTGLVAACRLSPRRHRVTSTRGLTFTTTVRVVDRVHGHTAVGRTDAAPAACAGLAEREMFSWSVLPTWPMVAMHSTSTRRVSPEGSFSRAYSPSFATSCAGRSGGAHHLRTLAGPQLDGVHGGTGRDVLERQAHCPRGYRPRGRSSPACRPSGRRAG